MTWGAKAGQDIDIETEQRRFAMGPNLDTINIALAAKRFSSRKIANNVGGKA